MLLRPSCSAGCTFCPLLPSFFARIHNCVIRLVEEGVDVALRVRTTLEDLAGNHILRAFDVDVFDRVTPKVTAEMVTLPLRIR